MRTPTFLGTMLGAALALTACGSGDSAGSPPPAPVATASSTAAAEPTEATTAPTLRGNAATNPACALLTTDQVATLSGLRVVGLLGLPADKSNPAKLSESCTWFLDPKVIQSSLVVQYTLYAKPPADVLGYYPQVVEQGFAQAVPKLGDVSKIQGHVLDTVHKRAEIHVSLLTHAEATPEDQAASIEIMRLVMAGLKQ